MTVQELRTLLEKLDQEANIMIRVYGDLREINMGPVIQEVSVKNGRDCMDCEMLVGKQVVVIGFGSY